MSVLYFLTKVEELGIRIELNKNDRQLKIKAPEGVINPALISEMKRRKQEIIEFLENAQKQDRYESIEPAEKKEYYGMSSTQKRLYVLQQIDRTATAYNMPYVWILEGLPDKPRLESAFKALVQRHESTRTSFKVVHEELVQVIHDTADLKIEYSRMMGQDRRSSMDNEIEKIVHDFIRPFDLSRAPLLRLKLIQIETEKHILMVDIHHSISDGVSHQILGRDFLSLYGGKELHRLRLQYKDYSQWYQQQGEKEEFSRQEIFWLKEFEGKIPTLDITTDYRRPAIKNFEGGRVNFELDAQETSGLNEVAQSQGATLFMVLLAVFNVFLSKLSGQEDIVVGIPIAGRRHPDLEPIIGMFVNTLALRNHPSEEKNFSEFLAQVKQKTLKAFENQDYPFEELVEKVTLERDISRNPLFDVMFSLQNQAETPQPISSEKSGGLKIRPYSYENKKAQFDLTLMTAETPQQLRLVFGYSTKLFRKETIYRFISYFKQITTEVIDDKNRKISEIEIISEVEKKKILSDFNDNAADFRREGTICQLIENLSEMVPGSIAAACQGNNLSYGELDRRSNQLAYLLRKKGIRNDCLVGILCERSIEIIIGILAVWKAGGAYIPIDIKYPCERINTILADSNAEVILTKSIHFHDKEAFFKEMLSHTNVHDMIYLEKEKNIQKLHHLFKTLRDSLLLEKGSKKSPRELTDVGVVVDIRAIETYSKENLRQINDLSDLSYVIYTSGSTGKPKGAMVEHIGMMNHIQAKINDLHLTANSIIAQNASHTFDISIWQLFTALALGGKTVVYPNELILLPERFINQIIKDEISILEVVPSYLSVILDYIDEGPTDSLPLRYLLVTGEEIKPNLVKRWFNRYPGIKMVNAYGPTEVSDDITHHTMVNAPEMKRIPIGKPLQNLDIYIVDKNMRLCPIGVIGEICVSGLGVGRGYLNDPGRTIEVFMEDPFSETKGVRLYKTGDLGYWLSDGNIEFFGRKDHQVKIRGFRIELGEIEKQLTSNTKINEAVVVDKEDKEGNKYLCAYVVKEGNGELNTAEMKRFLSESLPDYMVPTHFVMLDKIPLTPNGKIDRKALPEPDLSFQSAVMYISKKMLKDMRNKNLELQGVPGDVLLESLDDWVAVYEKERITIEEYSKQQGHTFYPLNHAQKMVYNVEKTYPQTSCENYGYIVLYRGKFDRELLEKAINLALYRNENLRTRVVEVEYKDFMGAVQYISHHINHSFNYFEFPGKDGKEHHEKWAEENLDKPFHFLNNDLFYFAIIKMAEEEFGFYIKVHHIISDGGSTSLLIHEIDKIYQDLLDGKPVSDKLNPSHIQYVFHERDYFRSSHIITDREFWLKYLLPLPEEIVLSSKKEGPSNLKGNFTKLIFHNDLRMKMHKYCRIRETSLYKLILSALSIYISQVTGLDEFIIGTVNHGRYAERQKNMMGMFINFIPLKITIDANADFQEFLKKIGLEIKDILKKHSKYPGDILTADIRKLTGKDTRYFWNISLVDHPDKEKRNFHIEHISSHEKATPLTIHINCSNKNIDGILELEWVYQLEKFSSSDIILMHQRLINIMTGALNNPKKKLREIEIFTKEEKAQILFKLSKGHLKGMKIDLNLIENCLLKHKDIKDAIALLKEKKNSLDKRLFAFVTSEKILLDPELRKFLSGMLPSGMIPSHFIQLEKIPLTPTGKIDKELLKSVEILVDDTYDAPRNEVEKKLAEIWSEVLMIEKDIIGIDSNFFQLGGHSLKATLLTAKIHKLLEVKVPLAEIFKTPTIKGLSGYIKKAAGDNYISIEPAEKKDYYELSSAQSRLYILQQLEEQGIEYNIPSISILKGDVDKHGLFSTFNRLIKRHESLRTSFLMRDEVPVQRIHDEIKLEIKYFDLGGEPASRVLHHFIRPFDLAKAPLLRVGLIKEEAQKHILMVDMHHIITDGTSQQILIKEFLLLYAGEELPSLRLQYKDYSEWQQHSRVRNALKEQEEYWLNQFKGEIPILNIPTDFPRPMIQGFEGSRLDFIIEKEVTTQLMKIASQEGVTLFMVILAIFNIMLSKISGQEDIVVGTAAAGRRHADLENIIGMFVNMLTLRNFPTPGKTFNVFLQEVKEKALKAFENQDYQYEDLVERVSVNRDPSRNPIFDVVFSYIDRDQIGVEKPKQEKSGLHNESYRYEDNTAKFDLILNGAKTDELLFFNFEYSTKLFKKNTIERFISHFKETMYSVIKNPHARIWEIEIVSEEEEKQLLKTFVEGENNECREHLNPGKDLTHMSKAEFDF